MKQILFLALLLPHLAFGRVASIRLDTSAVNLTASFADASGPVGLPVFKSLDTLMIDNQSASEIVVNCSAGLGVIPSNSSTANIYIQGHETWSMPDLAGFTPYCYWRAKSGTISSGLIVLTGVGH